MMPDNQTAAWIMAFDTFVFDTYHIDVASGHVTLRYRFEGGDALEEQFYFPSSARVLSKAELTALDHAVRLLFFIAGVSYYKAFAPQNLISPTVPLDRATADFARRVYYHGLGEFAFTNQIDLSNRLHFQVWDQAQSPLPERLSLTSHALVPVGGGKDSIVSIETLRHGTNPMTLFALSPASGIAQPIADTIAAARLPYMRVSRTLSPHLKNLNEAGAYNGHVPITAILSIAAVIAALLAGFNTVILSNEHSADAPNTVHHGQDVNHQYSKSSAFEHDLANYIAQHISPDLSYFSLLRPLTETAIAARFARMEKYHDIFRSCNANFRHDPRTRGSGWCGTCPKCHFVFLALAPFMDKDRILAIFGKNLLADSAQLRGYEELCGLSAHKPLECVGTVEESVVLMQTLAARPAWASDAVVRSIAPRLPCDAENLQRRFAALFDMQTPHFLSPYYEGLLRDAA